MEQKRMEAVQSGAALPPKMIENLITTALKMRKRAYCPYSGYSVGAALLTKSGKIYGGCNIENAAYPDTVCGERTAIFKAISEGECAFVAIAVAGGRSETPEGYSVPCGSCRQVMNEFCDPDDFTIVVAKSTEEYKVFTLRDLLPESFSPAALV